jgi:hypothetical protein
VDYALEVRPADGELFYAKLPTSGALSIGRDAAADLVLPDSFLSRIHFHIQVEAGRIFLVDLGSTNGTHVNGLRITRSELRHGDAVRAGRSVLRLTALLGEKAALIPPPSQLDELTPLQAELVASIEKSCNFAVLDGAADPAVIALLNAIGATCQSLYEGEQAVDVAPFGPFLVDLKNAHTLLQHLVVNGWGKSWGVFLHADVPFEDLRKHLRHFLIVNTEDGRNLLFRFYDPRVLRMFLPTCDPQQRSEFFGPIKHFVVELPDTNTLSMINR